MAIGQINWQRGIFSGPLEKTFNFSDFSKGKYRKETDLQKFRRTFMRRGDAELKKTGDYKLSTNFGEITDYADSKDVIFAYSLTSSSQIPVASHFHLSLYRSDGRLVRRLPGHPTTVYALSPSADGKYLASASDDQTFKLWDLKPPEPQKVAAATRLSRPT